MILKYKYFNDCDRKITVTKMSRQICGVQISSVSKIKRHDTRKPGVLFKKIVFIWYESLFPSF